VFRGGHQKCPRRAAHFFDLDTGEHYALACGSLECPFCIETQIWRAGIALEHAAPERYIVCTNVPGDWETFRTSMNRFHQIIDRTGRAWRDCYTLESGDKTGMKHVNIWQHGDYFPQEELSEITQRVGWGEVAWIQKWESGRRDYGMKEGSGRGYGMKEGSGKVKGEEPFTVPAWGLSAVQRAYLDRNGGRLLHARPSYWRDGAAGETLGSRKKVLERAMVAMRGPKVERQSWAVLMGSELVANSPVPVPASATLSGLTGGSMTAELLRRGLLAASAPSPEYLDFPGF
jgi:hypothetical protein